MIKLRPYQEEAIESTLKYFQEEEGNPLIVLPTGTGKSVVIADFCKRILTQWPDTKILVITHVRELIRQNYEELKGFWPEAPAGINSAGLTKGTTILQSCFAVYSPYMAKPRGLQKLT